MMARVYISHGGMSGEEVEVMVADSELLQPRVRSAVEGDEPLVIFQFGIYPKAPMHSVSG